MFAACGKVDFYHLVIYLALWTAGKMVERMLVERMGEQRRPNYFCSLHPSYDRWAIPESWVRSPPNWEEEELGAQLAPQHLGPFYIKSIWKLPMRSCSFRREHIVLNLPGNLVSFRGKIFRRWWTSDTVLLTLNDKQKVLYASWGKTVSSISKVQS